MYVHFEQFECFCFDWRMFNYFFFRGIERERARKRLQQLMFFNITLYVQNFIFQRKYGAFSFCEKQRLRKRKSMSINGVIFLPMFCTWVLENKNAGFQFKPQESFKRLFLFSFSLFTSITKMKFVNKINIYTLRERCCVFGKVFFF